MILLRLLLIAGGMWYIADGVAKQWYIAEGVAQQNLGISPFLDIVVGVGVIIFALLFKK